MEIGSLSSRLGRLCRLLLGRICGPGYGRNVLLVFSGSVVGKVLTVGAAPVLSRLFSPGDYGIFGLFTGLLSILSIAGSLGYARAVVLPRSNREAAGLVWLSLGIVLVVTAVAGLAVWGLRYKISDLVNAPELAPNLGWLPAAMLATAAYETMDMWATRRKRFGQLSSANVARSGGMVGTQIGSGAAGLGGGGLIGGLIIGQVVAVVLLAVRQWQQDASIFKEALRWKHIRKLAHDHRDFPRLSLPAHLILKSGNASVPVLLSFFFTPAVVGLYWFGNRLIALATESLGHAVRRTFYQRAATLSQGGLPIHPFLFKNTMMMMAIGLVPTLLVVLAGPSLFEVVFGLQWREAGEYARWLVLMGLLLFISAPATESVYVLNIQKWLVWLASVQFLITVASLGVGGAVGDPRLAIMLLSISTSVLYLGHIAGVILYARRCGSVPEPDPT